MSRKPFVPKFSLAVTLPNGKGEQFRLPTNLTVDQVKNVIFKETPALFTAPRNEFVLGISENDLLSVEYDKIARHPTVRDGISQGTTVQLILFSRRALSGKNFTVPKNDPLFMSVEITNGNRSESPELNPTDYYLFSPREATVSISPVSSPDNSDNESPDESSKTPTQPKTPILNLKNTYKTLNPPTSLSSSNESLEPISFPNNEDVVGSNENIDSEEVSTPKSTETSTPNNESLTSGLKQSSENTSKTFPEPKVPRVLSPTTSRRGMTLAKSSKSPILSSFDNPAKEGWLTKKGGNFKTWNRRWFILKDNFISYFKSKGDPFPIGSIPLANCFEVSLDDRERRNTFILHTPFRAFLLSADTAEDIQSWISAIETCILEMGGQLLVVDRGNPKRGSGFALSASISYDNAEKEGWLTKMGANRKNWKRRWCVLKDHFIYYFRSQRETIPKGAIALQDCSIEEDVQMRMGKKHLFTIMTRHRIYWLYADNVKEMKEWIEFIARSISLIGVQGKGLKEYTKTRSTTIATATQGLHRLTVCMTAFSGHKPASRKVYELPPVGTSPYPQVDKMIPKELKQVFNIINHESQDNEESNYFRALMAKLISSENKDLGLNLALASTTTSPLPNSIPTQFFAKFVFASFNYSKSINCTVEDTIGDAMTLVLAKSKLRSIADPSSEDNSTAPAPVHFSTNPNDWVAKIPGRAEYILDPSTVLSSLVYVRQAISRRSNIQICLVERSTLPENLNAYLLQGTQHIPLEDNLQAHLPVRDERCYSSRELKIPLELRVLCVENLEDSYVGKHLSRIIKQTTDKPNPTYLFVQCAIYHAGKRISNLMRTEKLTNAFWNTSLRCSLLISEIPREARLSLTLYCRRSDAEKQFPLAWSNYQIFDFNGTMRSGIHALRMWPGECNPVGTCDACLDEDAPNLRLEFLRPPLPIAFLPPKIAVSSDPRVILAPEDTQTAERIEKLLHTDPLYYVSPEEKTLLWTFHSYYFYQNPKYLPKILLSVPWTDHVQVEEAYSILQSCEKLDPIEAMELLDNNFIDSKVREFAVRCLEKLTDEELVDYMLQLVQVLKYEPYHDSSLARYLIQRSLRNRLIVGHAFFWHLQAEMHVKQISHRYGLYMEAYLRGANEHRFELIKQMELGNNLRLIANIIKETPSHQRLRTLQNEVSKLLFTSSIHLSLNPRIRVSGVIPEKCKWMDSVTTPLWITFKNADPSGKPVCVIFKAGDDLRQDVLTLQMIGLMDKLWKEEGLDLHLTTYGCVATGDETGMIEVVPDSETTAAIQKKAGGATAALTKTPLTNWLREHAPTESAYQTVVENFTFSCAGYCVATYVLGIGDRHNDNIMCTTNGHLFHIDFAHFLGNIMKFGIIKRDKAPFVLTPEFAHVMGGTQSPSFEKFIILCCKAYNILRKHANLFITLFAMMLSTGIPQLRKPEDLHYLRDAFSMNMNEEEAAKVFHSLIYESLNTKTTQVNFLFHILAHSGKT